LQVCVTAAFLQWCPFCNICPPLFRNVKPWTSGGCRFQDSESAHL
jgi:hypothetical protein